MAETVVINIEANTQGLQTTIDLLTKLGVVEQKVADEFKKTNEQNVQSLNKGVQQTTKEFEKLDKAVKNVKADNQLAKSLDASKEITKTGNSFQSLRQQFKEATLEAQQLADKYGDLDARTLAAARRAGQLKDQIGDVNAQINALTPEGKFQAIQNLGGAIAGIFQVATGALQAFGVESEQATKIAQQFQGALNIFGGLSQLSQLKDSLTAVKAALGLTTAAQVTNTVAAEANTVANVANAASLEVTAVASEAAAVGTRSFTAALAANPITAVLVAITGLVAGLYALSEVLTDVDEGQQAVNDSRVKAFGNVSEEIIKVEQLTSKYQDVNTTYEDRIRIGKELVDNYPEYFKNLDVEKGKIVDLSVATRELVRDLIRKAEIDAGVRDIAAINAKIREEENKTISEQTDLLDNLTAASVFVGTGIVSLGGLLSDALDIGTPIEEAKASLKDAADTTTREATRGLKAQRDAIQQYVNSIITTDDIVKETETQAAERRKKESEKAKKDAEDLAKAKTEGVEKTFQDQLKKTETFYTALRNFAKVNSENEEQFGVINTEVTAKELREKIALYEKYGKDVSGLLVQLKENADKAAIIDIPNVNPVAKAVETINTEFAKIKPKEIKITGSGGRDLEQDIQDQADKLKEGLADLALTTGLDIAFQQLDQFFQDSIDRVTELKDAQLEAITEEEEALNESYENRKIGKRELELEQERLTRQRVAAEKKAEKEIIEIKKKQDLANRAAALFNIGINTAVAVTKTTAELGAILAAPLIPLIIAQGALQAAAVLAQPLPKYKKGTLSVGGVGNEDTQLALLQPGEAVIPTETNKRYHPAIKAIYHGKIKPDDINNFVNLKLRGDYSSSEARPVMAKMDTSDLYALGRIMKKNDGVYVKNIGELAAMILDSYNPRR